MFILKLLLSAVGIVVVAYLIFSSFNGSQTDSNSFAVGAVNGAASGVRAQTRENSPAAQSTAFSSENPRPQSVRSVSTTETTYRPGVTRAQKLMNDTVPNMIYDQKKNWWLYGRSEKDAKWLDQFGYPTPEEHERLSNASDPELESLAKNGDLNARAHQAVRIATKAYGSGNINDLINASELLTAALNGGGPYQATMVGQGFSRMAAEFRRLSASEQTEERRSVIQSFSEMRDQAYVISRLYGDDFGQVAQQYMNNEDKTKYLGLRPVPNLPAETSLSMIVNMARWREQNGLPPITISPRPSGFSSADKGVIERY
jgi:hypothetical protein